LEDEEISNDDVYDNSEETTDDVSQDYEEYDTDENPGETTSDEMEDEEEYDIADQATDEFGGDVNDPMGFDKEVSEEPTNTPSTEVEDE